MTPAKLRADAEATATHGASMVHTAELFGSPAHVVNAFAEMGDAVQRTARAALALAELMPHLERLEAATNPPPEANDDAVARAEQYAIASLVFAFNAMKESLR